VQFFKMLSHAVPRLALGLPPSLSRTMQRPVSKGKFPRLPACSLSAAKPGPCFPLVRAPLLPPGSRSHGPSLLIAARLTDDDDCELPQVNVVTGALVCTETGRKFPISAGIPNMLLVQDEL
jgi:uncharacterized protein YbaR (Trm112 family)